MSLLRIGWSWSEVSACTCDATAPARSSVTADPREGNSGASLLRKVKRTGERSGAGRVSDTPLLQIGALWPAPQARFPRSGLRWFADAVQPSEQRHEATS